MNSVIICFVGFYFAIMVNTVSGGKCEEYPARHGIMNAPFNFAYLSGSEFNILMQLKNVSPKIAAIKVAVETDDPASKNKYEWDRENGYQFRLCGELSYNKVTIGLELYSSNGLCATKVVSEGRHARILKHGVADSTYESGHFCLHFPSSTCAIEIDMRNYCIESKTDRNAKREKTFLTPKPTHHYSDTTRNTSITPKPTTSASPKAPQNIPPTTRNTSISWKPTISDTPKAPQNTPHKTRNTSITWKPTISDTPKAPQNIPHTTQNTSITWKPTISDNPKAPLNIPHTTRNTSITPKPTISDTPKAPQNIPHTTQNTSITPKPTISDTPKAPQNIPHTPRNTSITPKPTISDSPKAPQNIPHTTQNTSINPKHIISDTPKTTKNILHTTSNTSITPRPTISDTPKATQNVSDTSKSTRISNTSNATWVVWDIADTFNTTLNESDTPTATRYTSDTPTTIQNMSDTRNATVIGINDAVAKKYAIAIASAIFGIALSLLVIIAIWKCCWSKRNPSGTTELLSNDQCSPFYLNLLFRRECAQEIELIEQHHYEEINPQ